MAWKKGLNLFVAGVRNGARGGRYLSIYLSTYRRLKFVIHMGPPTSCLSGSPRALDWFSMNSFLQVVRSKRHQIQLSGPGNRSDRDHCRASGKHSLPPLLVSA